MSGNVSDCLFTARQHEIYLHTGGHIIIPLEIPLKPALIYDFSVDNKADIDSNLKMVIVDPGTDLCTAVVDFSLKLNSNNRRFGQKLQQMWK